MGFGICGRLTDVTGAGRYTAVSQALKAAPGDCNNGETESLFLRFMFFFFLSPAGSLPSQAWGPVSTFAFFTTLTAG